MIDVEIIEDEPVNVEIDELTNTGTNFKIGDGLKLIDNVLSVDTAEKVEKDNTKPVTSGAVHMEIGNIEVLLENL